MTDLVHRPPHYTEGRRFEAIDVIEDAVTRAPDAVLGSLQWQVLKYVLRIWDKDDPCLDAGKARWYLNRLIDKLEHKPEAAGESTLLRLPLQQESRVAIYDDDGETD